VEVAVVVVVEVHLLPELVLLDQPDKLDHKDYQVVQSIQEQLV
jgi:hypothetical protein